jgi:hypothetical protein
MDVEAAKAGRGSDSGLVVGEMVAVSAGPPCVAMVITELGELAAKRLF